MAPLTGGNDDGRMEWLGGLGVVLSYTAALSGVLILIARLTGGPPEE